MKNKPCGTCQRFTNECSNGDGICEKFDATTHCTTTEETRNFFKPIYVGCHEPKLNDIFGDADIELL